MVRCGLGAALFAAAGCAQGLADVPEELRRPTIVSDAGTGSPRDAGPTSVGRDGGRPPSDATFGFGVDGGTTTSGSCTPAPETCNGIDDDCDGSIDEGAGCPCAHVEDGGRAYLVCDEDRSWAAAQLRCAMYGYEIAKIEDATEDAFVYAQISARGFRDTWIGHNDLVTEGDWVWPDGSPLAYAHWDAGEPNDGGDHGEDCGVIMTRDGRESEWDDRPCEDGRPFVCEAPAP